MPSGSRVVTTSVRNCRRPVDRLDERRADVESVLVSQPDLFERDDLGIPESETLVAKDEPVAHYGFLAGDEVDVVQVRHPELTRDRGELDVVGRPTPAHAGESSPAPEVGEPSCRSGGVPHRRLRPRGLPA